MKLRNGGFVDRHQDRRQMLRTAVEEYLNPRAVREHGLEPLVPFRFCPCDDDKEAAHRGVHMARLMPLQAAPLGARLRNSPLPPPAMPQARAG